MSHLNQQDFSPSEDTFFFPEDAQDKRKVKFQELGAKAATMYLTLKKQEERLKKRYVTWVVSSSVTSFILGNVCMFFIR